MLSQNRKVTKPRLRTSAVSVFVYSVVIIFCLFDSLTMLSDVDLKLKLFFKLKSEEFT